MNPSSTKTAIIAGIIQDEAYHEREGKPHLDDDRIRRYFELGCEVKALGRGHIQRIKEEVRAAEKAKLKKRAKR